MPKTTSFSLTDILGLFLDYLQEIPENLKMSSGTSINTATNTDSTLYTWLCVMSLGMLTFVTKRLRKQD